MKLSIRTTLLSVLFFLQLAILSASAFSSTFNAFGPQIFQRATGNPQTTSFTFSVLNPNTQYTLHVFNAGVASAVVSVNGKQILSEADFKPGVTTIDRSVILLPTNRIDVTVRSKPGSSFQLSVVGVDNDAPVITATASPAANAFNWNNGNVVITFKCSDATSGIAICPAPVSVTAEGANQSISGTAVDNAGNKATASVTLNIDKTQPTVAPSVAPTANSSNWNNTNVTVSFLCADALSGVASCTGPVTFANEGANQTATGTAVDKAGNSASTIATINIDKTPPTITVTSPANNSTVSTSTLQVTGSVTDALSGVAAISCNSIAALVQSGSFTCSTTLAAGLNTVNVRATDVAGNTTTTPLSVTLSNAQPVITDFSPKSGPVGTLVTLNGSNLTSTGNPTQIALNQQGGGSINAPISSATGTTLAFVIPAGAATGPITVTSSGQSATSAVNLQVTAASSFTIGAGPGTATLLQGKTAAYSVSLDSADGFSQLAKLSVSGVPAGATASFAPPQITAGQTSILTVSAPATQPTGSSILTISAAATVDGIPSAQTANVSLSVQPVTTSFFGRVVESDTIESPLQGIVITFLGVDDAAHTTGCSGRTVADAAGNFIFTNLPDACTGRQLVQYNGLTASDGEAYAGVNLAYTITKGQATGPELVHLPRIDNAETVMVKQNDTADQTFGFKTMPGISVTVYAGTVFTMPDGTQPDPFPFTGVEVPVDRLPDAPVDGPGTLRAFIVAFQPADTNSNQPVAVSFPNFINTPPGVNMELDTLDPVVGDLVKYGTGTVSGDGTQVVPDQDPAHPGHRYGIQHFDWHGPMAPAPPSINPPGDFCPLRTCSPIDLATGLEIITETDYVLESLRGSVWITRTYRTLSGNPGPFGIGTGHNYSYQLNIFNLLQGQRFVTLIMPDGSQYPLVQQQDSTFTAPGIPILRGASLVSNSSSDFILTFKNKTKFQFQTSAAGPRTAFLTSVTDPNGNTTRLLRNNPNSPVEISEIIDPVGRTITIEYDNFDRILSITDPIGRSISYTYNSQGTLSSVTNASGAVTTYQYDSQNRLTSITDGRGIVTTQNIFDENGRVIEQTLGNGGVTHFTYSLLNPNLSTTATMATSASVSLAGGAGINTSPVLLTTVTDPRGNQSSFHFSAQGFLNDVTDSLGQTKVFTRDPESNLVTSITGSAICGLCGDSAHGDTFFTYDTNGNVLSHANSLGNKTTFTYDPVTGRRTSFTDPAGNIATVEYDLNGNVTTQIDANGFSTHITYGQFGLPQSITDEEGNVTAFEYDPQGNLVTVTDPQGNKTRTLYDGVSRAIQTVDALGRNTHVVYDASDRVVSQTDALGRTIAMAYDPVGNLVSFTDQSGVKTTFTYDSQSRLLSRLNNGKSDKFSYDENENLIGFVDRRGQTGTFTYDAVNQLTDEIYSDGSSVKRTYDTTGKLIAVKDTADGVTTYRYDPTGRLLVSANAVGTIGYAYDSNGRVVTKTINGTEQHNYSYDPAGSLLAVNSSSVSQGFQYDKRRSIVNVTRGNGIASHYSYDSNGRVTSILHESVAGSLSSQQYSYDQTGMVTQETVSPAQPLVTGPASMAYDSENHLVQNGDTRLTYDENGNLLTSSNPSQTLQYLWDTRNRLTNITSTTGQSFNLGYDFQGNLTALHATGPNGSLVRRFLIDDISNVAAVNDPNGSTAIVSGRSMDQHLASTDPNGSTLYRLADAQNSTVATVDQLGSVQSRFFYEPYGHTTALGPPAIFEYIGRIPITDTLYDFRARTYDTETSRFLREDPIQFAGGDSNFYAYARDNPINLTDPTGLAPNKQFCQRLLEKIENVQNSIDKRIGELDEDPLGLPETCSGDDTAPSLSRQGHRRLINEDKALLAALKGTYLALCSDDPPNGTPAPNESFFDRKYWEKITGLTGAALIAYLIISEGSRLFPPRNLVPVP